MANLRPVARELKTLGQRCCASPRPGKADRANRLFLRASIGSRNPAYRHGNHGSASRKCPKRHLTDHRLTDRTVGGEGLRRDAEHLFLGSVAVGHEAPIEPAAAARDVRHDFGDPPPGTGLGSRQGAAIGL